MFIEIMYSMGLLSNIHSLRKSGFKIAILIITLITMSIIGYMIWQSMAPMSIVEQTDDKIILAHPTGVLFLSSQKDDGLKKWLDSRWDPTLDDIILGQDIMRDCFDNNTIQTRRDELNPNVLARAKLNLENGCVFQYVGIKTATAQRVLYVNGVLASELKDNYLYKRGFYDRFFGPWYNDFHLMIDLDTRQCFDFR